MITTRQAGSILGLSPKSITKYIELGKIKAEKIGRDYIMKVEEVERFKQEKKKCRKA